MNTCSLLIPCHNAAQYLPRLWETVRSQTVPFDEIICYDDSSTDNTVEVATELGATVIRGETCRGAAFVRNQLAQAATCNWIHFHDADDTLHPEYLALTKARIQSNLDVIVNHSDWIDETTHKLLIARRYYQQDFNQNAIAAALINPIGVISCLYRRDAFLAVGGFDESFQCWEDADLQVRLAANNARFGVVEQVLAYSLRHDRGLSSDQSACASCRLRLLKSYAEQFIDLRDLIAAEAERVAIDALIRLKDRQLTDQALQLCVSLGLNPPTTHNRFLQIAKRFTPRIPVLYLQQFIRNPKPFFIS